MLDISLLVWCNTSWGMLTIASLAVEPLVTRLQAATVLDGVPEVLPQSMLCRQLDLAGPDAGHQGSSVFRPGKGLNPNVD